MRAMADAVVARCIEHIATLPEQPSCGDVDMVRVGELCQSMKEGAPERGTALEPFPYEMRVRTIPEPETWALLIGGFGLVGAGLRRSRALRQAQPGPLPAS